MCHNFMIFDETKMTKCIPEDIILMLIIIVFRRVFQNLFYLSGIFFNQNMTDIDLIFWQMSLLQGTFYNIHPCYYHHSLVF